MSLRDTWNLLTAHPLTRDRKLTSFVRYIRWQVASLIAPGDIAVPFVNDSLILARFGMAAATGNVYAGLYEFEDMAFVVHLLRSGDLFVDVGANIGSYTILAGAVAGADCVSIEPVPSTYEQLRRNVQLNGISQRTELRNVGIGRERGTLDFIGSLGPMSRAAVGGERPDLKVEVLRLVEVLGDRQPTCIKVDVEGFETNVVAGGEPVFQRESLLAVVMEHNGNGKRYGFDEEALHQRILSFGFEAVTYHPFERRLRPRPVSSGGSDNILYVRNAALVEHRLAEAPAFNVNGKRV